MKKFLFTTILMFIFCVSYAQDFSRLIKNEKTGLVTITEIIEFEGQNKNDIYAKTKLWISQSYKSEQNVIQLDDLNSGIIVIKGVFDISQTYVHYTFTIKIKDGKMKLDTDHIYSDSSKGNPNYGWGYAEEWIEGKCNGYKQLKFTLKQLSMIANTTIDKINALYDSLESSINEPLIVEEDW